MPVHRRALALPAIASIAVAVGCGSGGGSSTGASQSAAARSDAGKSLVYVGASDDPAYNAIACGAKLEARKRGAKLTVQYPTAFSAAAQTPLVNSVAAGKPNGIIISPADANAMYAPLLKAKAQGISLVTALNTLSKADPLASQVLADEDAGGRLAAQLVARKLGKRGGKVALITFTPGQSVPADTRWHNFEKQIRTYPQIDYVGRQITDITAQTATQKMNAILARHPDVKAVVATFGIAGEGAAAALRQRHRHDVYLVTYDTRAGGVAGLKAGSIAALIDYKQRDLGAQAVDRALAAADDKPVSGMVKLPPAVFTKANVDTPASKPFLQATSCPR